MSIQSSRKQQMFATSYNETSCQVQKKSKLNATKYSLDQNWSTPAQYGVHTITLPFLPRSKWSNAKHADGLKTNGSTIAAQQLC